MKKIYSSTPKLIHQKEKEMKGGMKHETHMKGKAPKMGKQGAKGC